MKLVRVKKEKTYVKVKMSRKDKTVIKNMTSLLMMIAGILSMGAATMTLVLCDPDYSILVVPTMIKYILLSMVLMFGSPIVKHCIKF